jgi:hypothetical protein
MFVSIGIAYYMPNSDKTVIIPGRVGQLVALRRGLLSKTIKLLQLVLLGDSEPSLDDAITCFIVSSIGPSCWNYSCRWVIQALLSDRQYHF